MKKETLFELKSLYRDHFRVTGYRFGRGQKSVCIVGSLRGNEIQQLYICSQLVRELKRLEQEKKIISGKQILVIPTANPYSINTSKRFWPSDNTDINRMFPGYHLGETTQRIAAGIFEPIKDFEYGIQFTSFYRSGKFQPHVRMMTTGFENVNTAKKFGLPYVLKRKPKPYDTTTLNYNWQIWESEAFSIYTDSIDQIEEESAQKAVQAVLRFLYEVGAVNEAVEKGEEPVIIEDQDLVSVTCPDGGLFLPDVGVGEEVKKDQPLAKVLDPYEGEKIATICSPVGGRIFFARSKPVTYSNTVVFKIIPRA
ncbi:MAG: M14 family metallopeptidase [Lachnospiraceae bacterium]|nr:M14 family metallopeptidase [Lachnospiraceae bacterium]